jgi:hypothetical protein
MEGALPMTSVSTSVIESVTWLLTVDAIVYCFAGLCIAFTIPPVGWPVVWRAALQVVLRAVLPARPV